MVILKDRLVMSHRQIAGVWFVIAYLLWADLALADWPGWRGPSGFGLSDEQNLPLRWDAKTGENIRWKAKLGDRPCYSSPIVSGGRVFVAYGGKSTKPPKTEIKDGKEVQVELPDDQWLACFQTVDGRELWRTTIRGGSHVGSSSGYAAPTPVTDGARVYAWYGSGVLVAIDFAGKEVWRREFAGPLQLNPGICSSPVLYRDTVLLLVDQGGGKSFLAAVNTDDGSVRWEKKRPQVSHTNTTPLVIQVADRQQLLVAASNALQSMDPATGAMRWWCKAESFYPSPAFGNGVVFGDGGTVQAVDPSGEGDVTKTHVRWKESRGGEVIGSPIVVGEYVFRLQSPGVLTCYGLATGEKQYSKRLPEADWWASPVATADDRIYFGSAGTTHVIRAGPKFELLATNVLEGGQKGGSAAVADRCIFLCGHHQLYCIGTASAAPSE